MQRVGDRLGHLGRAGDEERSCPSRPPTSSPSTFASRWRVSPAQPGLVGHRQDHRSPSIRRSSSSSSSRNADDSRVAVRVDERDAVRQRLVGDEAEHRAEDGDPDPAGDEDVLLARVLREQERALRLLDLHLVAHLELGERLLERSVAQPRREPDGAVSRSARSRARCGGAGPSRRRGRGRAARPRSTRPGAIVGVVLDGEADEEPFPSRPGASRRRSPHRPQSTVSRRRRRARRARSPRRAAAASASAPRSARRPACRRRAAARSPRRGRTASRRSSTSRRRAAPSTACPGSGSYGRPTLPGLSSRVCPTRRSYCMCVCGGDDARGPHAGRELGHDAPSGVSTVHALLVAPRRRRGRRAVSPSRVDLDRDARLRAARGTRPSVRPCSCCSCSQTAIS